MENGLTGIKTETEYGKVLMEILMLANGYNQKQKDMEFIFGLRGTSMKVNGRIARSTEQGQKHLLMEICSSELTNEEDQMGKANTNGQMELNTLVILLMV